MNRQILFRAKEKENGKWNFGYYVFDNRISFKTFLITLSKGNKVEVISSTVGQCTAISSTNGFGKKTTKQIYEGDIVVLDCWLFGCPVPNDFQGTVAFMEGGWWVDNGSEAHLLWSDSYSWRIVGNIHD